MEPEFIHLTMRLAFEAGITLTRQQVDLLGRHIQLLLQANARLNLTRITDRDQIIIRHLLDSIIPADSLPCFGNSLDVGTGGGFPGIPLKIVYPDLQMLLLDSSRKKVSFLSAVTAGLGLNGIRAINARWQDFADADENRDKFQLITMRAVRLESVHIERMASRLLSPGGVFAWWGSSAEEEDGTPPGEDYARWHYREVRFRDIFTYRLPGMKRQRAVWIWEKASAG